MHGTMLALDDAVRSLLLNLITLPNRLGFGFCIEDDDDDRFAGYLGVMPKID